MPRDELDRRLRETFLQELEDQLAVMESGLLTLEADPENREAVRTLFRAAHSVKGAARVAGVPLVERACHALEAIFAEVRDGRRTLSGGDFSLLFAVTDALGETRRRLGEDAAPAESTLNALLARLGSATGGEHGTADPAGPGRERGVPTEPGPVDQATDSSSSSFRVSSVRDDTPAGRREADTPPRSAHSVAPPAPGGTPIAPVEHPTRDKAADGSGVAEDGGGSAKAIDDEGGPADAARGLPPGGAGLAAHPDHALPARGGTPAPTEHAEPPPEADADRDAERRPAAETVRVSTDRLDELAAHASDLLTTTGAIATLPRALEDLRDRLSRWAAEWRNQSRDAATSFDRDEHAELDRQLHQLAATVARLTRESLDHTRILSRATDDILVGVRGLRMRRLAEAVEGLPRAARDIAAETGKEVRLVVEGEDVEADRMVIDALREPLLHLVRNAVDHGIEPPADRVRQGKPAEGTVLVAAKIENGRLRIVVEDDGRGIDTAAVRRKLAERGEPPPKDARALARRLLAGGLTTREEATSFSGRGVGLDIVGAAMERIGGSVGLRWREGGFTRIVLDSPPSPTTLRAVIAEASDQLFALPIGEIERVVRVQPSRVREVEGRPTLALGEAPIPIATLAGVLGSPLRDRQEIAGAPALVIRAGEESLALVVDAIADEREVVVRPLERRAHVPLVAGGALLPSGRVALVLIPRSLVEAGLSGESAVPVIRPPEAAPPQLHVLVVDDSITTRTLEQSVLEAAGYRVTVAVDGQDAWDRLVRDPPDLVVSDVEMPRMNGFDLCRRIRASRRYAELPVVLVTGMETAEDRALGMEVGADAYVLKSSFDQAALLDTIRQLID